MVRPSTSILLALILAWLLAPAIAVAQVPFFETPSAQDRAQMFAELEREVTAWERQGNILKKVIKLVLPSVAHIEAEKTEAASVQIGGRRAVEEAGSGVLVQFGDKIYVLTNRHVVSDAPLRNITISLVDGRHLTPTRVWADPETDVAVLALPDQNLVAAHLGDSDKLEMGDFVVAMGSPFGLNHSVTYGIVSAKGRRDLQFGSENVRYQDFIQTDVAINPGNSGGPLITMRGEVVGINTAIASATGRNEGIGFTIPINMARAVAIQLIERGSVARAFLGVHLDSRFSPEKALRLGLPRQVGARVTGVIANSPASVAKLQVDDVILQFNGVRVDDDNHLVNLVSLTPLGKEVPVLIYRERKPLTITVKVDDKSKFPSNR